MAAGSISGSSPWMLTMISAFSARGDFGHAIGAGGMVGAGHPHPGAELPCGREHPSSSVAMIVLVRYWAIEARS